MKRAIGIFTATMLAVLSAGFGARAADSVNLPAGTLLRVRLDDTITSKTNKAGDTFKGLVTQALIQDGKTLVPEGSLVTGHIAYLKPAGRIKSKAQMRIVLDSITTPDDKTYRLSSTLEDTKGGVCGNTPGDSEGTIQGCGKSKKDAAKDAAIGAAMGGGAGATIGMGSRIDCVYFGNCGGPGIGESAGVGAAAGAGTVLLYHLFKKEKEIVLVRGTELSFVINRTVDGSAQEPAASGATK